MDIPNKDLADLFNVCIMKVEVAFSDMNTADSVDRCSFTMAGYYFGWHCEEWKTGQ